MEKLFAKTMFMMVILCSLLGTANHCFAQAVPDTSLNNIINDTVRKKKEVPDTNTVQVIPARSGEDSAALIAVKTGPFQPNPKKAGLYSALIPGLGQLYNRQYWKLPLVYVAVGAAGYFFIDNLTNYQDYRKAYIGRINNNNPTDKYVLIYSTAQLQQLQNDYSKYLDMTVLFSALGYAIQVIDAITSAHLKNFDISRDISMRMRPVVMPTGGVGMGLVMNF